MAVFVRKIDRDQTSHTPNTEDFHSSRILQYSTVAMCAKIEVNWCVLFKHEIIWQLILWAMNIQYKHTVYFFFEMNHQVIKLQ